MLGEYVVAAACLLQKSFSSSVSYVIDIVTPRQFYDITKTQFARHGNNRGSCTFELSNLTHSSRTAAYI
eukprot:3154322-Pleurochrysis_carterae.AAC.2